MPLAPTHRRAAPAAAIRTPLAVAAMLLGAAAAGAAVLVACRGVYRPYSWYVVVGLAVIAVACGLPSVGRRHHRGPAGGIVARIGTVFGLVALVLGGWGVSDVVRTAPPAPAVAQPTPARVATPLPVAATTTNPPLPGPQVPFGRKVDVDGVSIRLVGPLAYRPSPLAATSDGSPVAHAVEFGVTITNGTVGPLNAVGVDVQGFVGGQAVGHVYDTGVGPLGTDVAPGQTAGFLVAFNLPTAGVPLVVQVSPQSMNSDDKVFYLGTV